MKKVIMVIVSCLAVVLASASFVFVNIQLESTQWDQLGSSTQSFEIYVTPEEQMPSDYVTTTLAAASKQYQANILKTDYMSEKGNSVVVKSVYLSYPSNTLDPGLLSSGQMLKPDDMDTKTYVQTPNLTTPSDVKQAGTLYSFFNANRVRIQPMSQMSDAKLIPQGTYVVEMKDLSQKDAFLSALAESLQMNKSDLTQVKLIGSEIGTGAFIAIGIFSILVCVILLAVLMSYYIVQQFKKIGVKKLLGFTSFSIWRSVIASILGAQCVTIAAVIITLKLAADAPMSYLIRFLILGLVVLGVTGLVSLIFLGMVRSYKISDLIKDRKPVRTVFIINMVARVLLLTVVCVSLFNLFPTINSLVKEYRTYQQWDQYGSQYVVADLKATPDMHSDLINNTHIYDKKYVDFYDKYANKNGAIYTRVGGIDPLKTLKYAVDPNTGAQTYPEGFNPDWVPKDFKRNEFIVNPNYLATFPVVGEDGKPISVSEQEEDGVYLVPDIYKNDHENMEKLFSFIYKEKVESSQRFAPSFGTNQSQKVKVIYYKAGKDVFTFDTKVGADSNYKVRDPIFNVMTQKNGTFIDKATGLRNMSVGSALKFDINKGEPEQQYEQMKPILQQYGLQDNVVALNKISTVFEAKIDMLKTGLMISIGTIAALFLLAVLISVQTVAIRMQMISRKIAVKKMLGFSFFGKYGKEMLIYGIAWFVQWLAASLICIAILSGAVESGGDPINPVVFLAALIILALDAVVLFGVTIYHDRKNTNCSIRRDE